MVAMIDTEEVDDYTVICKQKNGVHRCIVANSCDVSLFLAWLSNGKSPVVLSVWVRIIDSGPGLKSQVEIKAHNRGLVGIWAFRAGNGIVGLVTVGQDSVKLWRMDETVSGVVTLTSKVEIHEWRTAVQSADVTNDGKCICLVTIDSMFYEIILGDEGPVVMTHDFGVMEAWHVRIAKTKTNYITTAFSGFLKEIDLNGKIARQEPFQYAKSVGALSFGNGNKRLAISTFEGVLHIIDAKTLKSETTIEAHSKRIRALAFLPGEDDILTGSDDKTIKLHSVSGERPKVERVYCGHRSPVLSLAIDERADGTRFASSSLDGQVVSKHFKRTVKT
uniref:WD_REPEATS_REGION domain-containing protein n=1 Tax=Angiostrongylus cantonensis TaxID=6313 RepID=A0A0K0DQS0_ANGCA